jgi:NADH-quinone oxidoreductase subunit N
MVSLAGLPPTGGFIAKLGVFLAAVESGRMGLGLALVGVLTSVISVYYYLRVAYVMFASPAATVGSDGGTAAQVRLHPSPLVSLALLVAAAAVLQIGVLPGALVAFTQQVGTLLK